MIRSITPFLWYHNQAEEAANFYTSVFKDSCILDVSRQGPDGPVVMASFELHGQRFTALNGGPTYSFTPAISFMVSCEAQDEVDELWEKLTSGGGEEDRCGWLTDRFGVSWQIVPTVLAELLGGSDPEAAQRAMSAMLQMKKLDIKQLRDAYNAS